MLLEEALAGDAVGAAQQRQRPPGDARQARRATSFQYSGQGLLGDAGPQLAVGMGDLGAADALGAATGSAQDDAPGGGALRLVGHAGGLRVRDVADHLLGPLVLAQAPKQVAWRSLPKPVQTDDSTSPTNAGSTQLIAGSGRSPASSSPTGGVLASRPSRHRRLTNSFSVKPVPTPPTSCSRPLSS